MSEFYELTLFVSGASSRSARAIADATELCDEHLLHRHRLSVVDIHEDPAAAMRSGVLAVPALVKDRPLPVRKHVGDLAQSDKVLRSLGLTDLVPTARGRG